MSRWCPIGVHVTVENSLLLWLKIRFRFYTESMRLLRDPVCGNFMCSFDVRSLFINVPLDENINICLITLYHSELSAPTIEECILKG